MGDGYFDTEVYTDANGDFTFTPELKSVPDERDVLGSLGGNRESRLGCVSSKAGFCTSQAISSHAVTHAQDQTAAALGFNEFESSGFVTGQYFISRAWCGK